MSKCVTQYYEESYSILFIKRVIKSRCYEMMFLRQAVEACCIYKLVYVMEENETF